MTSPPTTMTKQKITTKVQHPVKQSMLRKGSPSLQPTLSRRRYLRRGSKTPQMLASIMSPEMISQMSLNRIRASFPDGSTSDINELPLALAMAHQQRHCVSDGDTFNPAWKGKGLEMVSTPLESMVASFPFQDTCFAKSSISLVLHHILCRAEAEEPGLLDEIETVNGPKQTAGRMIHNP